MNPQTAPGRSSLLAAWAHTMIILAVSVAGLYYASGFLIPLTIAALLVVLLGSLTDRIQSVRIGGRSLPRWICNLVAILVAIGGVGLVLVILSNQARDVVASIPRYEARFDAILERVVDLIGEDYAARSAEAIERIDVAGIALGTMNSAGGFLGSVFMMLLFAAFLMVDRVPMRNRIQQIAPTAEAGIEIERTMRRSVESVQAYVSIKSLVSLITGLISYAIMKLIGLDFAETWAVLTFALNFIPSIGSIVAVVFPAIVALVQFDGITEFLVIVLGCGMVQFTIGNVIEPALTGKRLNLSPMVVILALTVWSALWGIPGAFLSIPITVCVMIVFAHVPGLHWIAVLMSGDGQVDLGGTDPPATARED